MTSHFLQSSLNAGELSPLLDARVGVEKYANGCRRLKNMIVSVHGPVAKRPGMQHLGAADNNTTAPRLIGLNFSATTSFVVEMTAARFRFWNNGALVPFTLPHPYADTDIYEVQAAQVNDVIYLTHPEYAPRVLERRGDADWRLRELHEPAAGWGSAGSVTPPTGNAVLERWFTVPLAHTTLDNAELVCATNPPGQTVPASGAPVGTGLNWASTIQRVRAWFVPPTTGVYKFRAAGVDDMARIRFNSTPFGLPPGATVIVNAGLGQTVDSAEFNLTAGSAYYIEFLLNDMTRPSSGTFRYLLGGVDQGPVPADRLAARLAPSVGTSLEGWPALLDENITPTTITPSATSGNITLTASDDVFLPGHVGAWWQLAHRRETAFTEIVAAEPAIAPEASEWLRVVGDYTVYSYGTWATTLYLEEMQADGSAVVIRAWRGNKDRNVVETGRAERESFLRLRVEAGTSSATPDSTIDNPRFLLESADSKVYGLVRITAVTSPTSATATVYASLHDTTATPYWTEGAWSAVQGFPRCVCLHQQRTNWGGTRKRPQSIWGSVTADFENFRRSTRDDGSYLYQIASENSFLIQWMLSQGDLVIGTSLDEWMATAPQEAPITPLNLSFRRQSAIGSAYRQAVLIRETVVFVQRNNIALSRLVYRENGRYGAAEISILASHLFQGRVRQMAWQAQPNSVLWVVLENGRLVGLTYEEDQNVFACHEHSTAGEIKSVAVIHGPLGDEVWLAVLRAGTLRIERFEPGTLFAGPIGTTTARRCYVDAAVLRESASPFADITGLTHLEGRTVAIFADGAQQPSRVVTGGFVTLDPPARVACVGLPYLSELQPMKLEAQMQNGTAQGRLMRASSVVVRLLDSLGGKVAASPEDRKEVIEYREVGMAMDAPPPIFTGDKDVVLESGHQTSVDVIVTHDEPLPFTVLALIVRVDIYEGR